MAIPFIPAIISGITSIIGKRQDRQAAAEAGKQKLAEGKQLNKSEWEALGVQAGMDSWKDEYITVVVTLPIPFIFIGNMVASFNATVGTKILEGNDQALQQLGTLMQTPYGQMMMWVALAAVGIKAGKTLLR